MIRITLFEGEWEKSREFAPDVVKIGRVKLRFDGASGGSEAPVGAPNDHAAESGLRKKHLHRRRRD